MGTVIRVSLVEEWLLVEGGTGPSPTCVVATGRE